MKNSVFPFSKSLTNISENKGSFSRDFKPNNFPNKIPRSSLPFMDFFVPSLTLTFKMVDKVLKNSFVDSKPFGR